MAITLAQAKVNMTDKIDIAVIDEFRRESFLLDKLTFDDAVAPATNGSTLRYNYTRLKTPSTASVRALNTEYTANEAIKETCHADLKIFGGRFELDRVIQNTSGRINEVQFQLRQKIQAARNYFHYMTINGDATNNVGEFDGLDVILTNSSTEYKGALGLDLSNSAMIDANYNRFMDALDEFLSGLDGKPDALIGGSKIINRIQAVARRAGYFTRGEDSFGRKVPEYNGIQLAELGKYYNGTGSVECAPAYSAVIGSGSEETTGLCDLYAVKFGLDGFHAVSPMGGKIINTYMPDFNTPKAVKSGEVEMVAAVVLKNTLKAGVMRGIKVQ